MDTMLTSAVSGIVIQSCPLSLLYRNVGAVGKSHAAMQWCNRGWCVAVSLRKWQFSGISCQLITPGEGNRCLNIVYADSLSPVSADTFHFSHSATYRNVLRDFAKSFDLMRAMPCDILLARHPLGQRDAGHPDAL